MINLTPEHSRFQFLSLKMFLPLCTLMVFFPDTVCASSEMVQFANFIQQFNKSYKSPKEFQYRLSVFSNNLKQANRLQIEELGTAEYGVTKFSDLTAEEFKSYGLNPNVFLDFPNVTQVTTVATFPAKHDWRTRGVISQVKNQGQCRSCWAFAVVGNIEAQWGIQGCPKNLSVQRGLVYEKEYQYEGVRKECREGLSPTAWINGFQMLPKNENAMTSYVGNKGTVTVTINSIALQHYKNGVIHTIHKNCDPDYVDHVVLLVGYGIEDENMPYWIVKNSYGPDWGEKGYFKILRGKNICGITKYPLAATVKFKKDKSNPCPP
ncbi:cathepsin W-like isoform X2 [Mixophyes fleayi]|uniref:cathepsin W-like isoform X2 n=1 Tax=Mixophyes fleayi TaxID=3061075 RepID=UPI003F4DBE0C